MSRIYPTIFIFISLVILILPSMSFSDQVSGQQVHGSPPFSGVSFGHADIKFDEEGFRKCLEKNKKKLEKAATKEVWEDMLKTVITDKIIAGASGGKISRYLIGTIVDKSVVSGVVPDSWKHTVEAITSIMTRCANDSTKKSLWERIFGGKKVSGQPVSGQSVSGQPVSGQPVSGQPVSGSGSVQKSNKLLEGFK